MNRTTDFMLNLVKQLIEQKKITESSASLYIRNLYSLNEKKPYTSLTFLKNVENIDKILSEYSNNTKKTMLASIVSVLSLFNDKPTYKKVYKHYYDEMMKKGTEMKQEENGEKNEKQKENWVEWKDVEDIKNKLYNDCLAFEKTKQISIEQYNKLLSLMILSLYTDMPPRRNQDYTSMVVITAKKGMKVEDLPKEHNYLIIDKKIPKEFVFNKYKTSKKYGTQILTITSPLNGIISMYLKWSPIESKKDTAMPFLLYSNGEPLSAVNSITRILNKLFGKKVGSSMLRHSYLTSKYGEVKKEQEDDAKAMGHSVSEQQNEYVKK